MEERIYTTEQIATMLQVHPFTVLKFIREGKLKGIKLGRVYRIKESDLNQFIEDRMTKGSAKSPKKIKEEAAKPSAPPLGIEKGEGDNQEDHYYII